METEDDFSVLDRMYEKLKQDSGSEHIEELEKRLEKMLDYRKRKNKEMTSEDGYYKNRKYNIGMQNVGALNKKQYFAAMALQGLCSNPNVMDNHSYEIVAHMAVKLADEMIIRLS